jgi:VIT1/CCC1 family predicted Fe2+/Mn2+ transporter
MEASRSQVTPAPPRRGLLWFLHPRDLPDPRAPHETRANTILRPVVFGANDGLVSNLALVMGVAGAAPEPGVIVLAGIAGLIAGAFSMGVGEYISVQSQRELLEYQLRFQRHQLATVPDQERRILSAIYQQRGLSVPEADQFVASIFEDFESATRLLIFEEVGLDERSIGSAWSAAVGSFGAFTIGAAIPLIPYLLASGAPAFFSSLAFSLVALFALGLGISRLTRRAPLPTAVRQLVLGGIAAAVTYAVGSAIGIGA